MINFVSSCNWIELKILRYKRQTLKLRTKLITLISFCFLLIPVFNIQLSSLDKKHIKFERITIEDGLSQSSVQSILQDHQGFIWLATQDGLNKYNGYDFKIYRHDPADENSISDNWINVITEDQSGRIWIGSNKGHFDRFDWETETFSHYMHDPNDPHSISRFKYIAGIVESPSGDLWIGGFQGGLNRLETKTGLFTHFKHDPANSNSLSNNNINTLHFDSSGNLWIGTNDGLNRYDLEKGIFTRYKHNPKNPHSLSQNSIHSICEDPSGAIWIGTARAGISKLNPKTHRFLNYKYDPYNPQSLSSNRIRRVFLDKMGVLWIGTIGGGLNRFDKEKEIFTSYQNDPNNPFSLAHNSIWSIYEDSTGRLWFGTLLNGISLYDRKKEKFPLVQYDSNNPDSLNCNSIRCFYKDQSGILWVGTHGGGLNMLKPNAGIPEGEKLFKHYMHDPHNPKSISHNDVWAILEDHEKTLWIGTSRGLDKFDRNTEQFENYHHLPTDSNSLSSDRILCLSEDQFGMIWIGTLTGGLNRFNPPKKEFTRFPSIPDDPKALSWATVRVIHEDQKGDLWIGTWGGSGLHKFNRKSNTFTRMTEEHGFAPINRSVTSLFEDSSGVFWIGTAGGGLIRFDPRTGEFKYFTIKDGLPNNTVYGILGDENGYLWLSTNSGLSRFSPQTKIFRNYTVSDGLQSTEFNSGAFYRATDGKLYFGGVKGYNAFYPNEIKDNQNIPAIVFTDFKVFNQSVKLKHHAGANSKQTLLLPGHISSINELKLSYRHSVFSFEFAALDFSSPDQNQYAYKMEGFDDDWRYTNSSRRFATYTNLESGRYIFRVKGSNNDGIWNEEGTSINILITPPPWKTWWAYTIYSILFLGIVFWFYRVQQRKIEKKHRELEREKEYNRTLEQKVNERTKDLVDAMKLTEAANQSKSRFLANMSHELRTPLNSILGFSRIVGRGDNLNNDQKDMLTTINRSGEYLLNLINDILDMSKIEKGVINLKTTEFDLFQFFKNLKKMFKIPANRKNLELKFDISPEVPQYICTDEGKLQQVLVNLIGNGLKFTKNGAVILRVNIDSSVSIIGKCWVRLLFEVTDTGPGIAEEERDSLFDPFVQSKTTDEVNKGAGLGLSISQRFIQMMGGNLSLESELGKGSKFSFCLQVLKLEKLKKESAIHDRHVIGLEPGETTYRILIVDDIKNNRDVLVAILKPIGFQIKEAENGKEAIKIWKEWNPHLIWMDLRMPEMDGFEATKIIKSSPEGKNTIIIAISASAFEDERERALAGGFDDYVRKPFREPEIFDKKEKFLNIRFLYQDEQIQQSDNITEVQSMDFDSIDLSIIPKSIGRDFKQALIAINMEKISSILNQIEPINKPIAHSISKLVNNYRFDILQKMFEEF